MNRELRETNSVWVTTWQFGFFADRSSGVPTSVTPGLCGVQGWALEGCRTPFHPKKKREKEGKKRR